MTAPFDFAETYRAKGWTGTLPLGVESKFPPPGGFTGYEGRWPTPDDIAGWRSRGFRAEGEHHNASNLALRLPAVAIGLDVDCYDGKTGAAELARLVEQWGPLPATWSSTSRNDGSRILLYRVPSGVDPTTWPTGAGPSIEIIRHAHRYAVVWPSMHPETGQPYRWLRPDGSLADEGEIPGLGDLPELPTAWLVRLTGHGGNGGHVKQGSRASRRETDQRARDWIATLPIGEPCAYVGRLAADLTGAARREDGNAYDTTRDAVMALLRAGETGHPGVRDVLLAGRAIYVETVADKRGGKAVAEGEFDRFTLGGAAKILDDPGDRAGRGCDCGGHVTISEPPDEPWGDQEPALVEDPDAEFERRAHRERQVAVELDRLRILDEARHRLAIDRRGDVDPPELLTLRDRLARPRTPTRWRVDGWQPVGSRVVLAAQFKAGKTTLVGNLVRSLIDGDDWLDKHKVTPASGTVAVLDFEMGADQLDDWLRDQRIRNDDRVLVVPMRGRAALFDLLDDRVLAEWAKLLRDRGTGYLALDCLRPILDALGLDEHRDAGRFFVALDQLLTDAGIADALVVHHMGHFGERSRGDSRIRDWPDVEWRLVRQDDEPGSARYISAYGRDVDVLESELLYDRTSRHLTIVGGSRRDAAIRAALRDVTAVLEKSTESLTGRAIEFALEGSEHPRATIRRAVALGIRIGTIRPQPGPRRSTLHSLSNAAEMSETSAPSVSTDQDQTTLECADDDQ